MQNPTPQAAFDAEAEYRTIERALLDSARGRWFLAEHGRRARRLDSALLEDAIGRLQGSLREPPALLGQLQGEIERMVAEIAEVRAHLLSRQSAAGAQSGEAPQTTSVRELLRAAEDLHERAWQLQGDEIDAERCQAIARDAARISALSQAQAFESQRTTAFASSLSKLDERLAAVLATIRHEMEVDLGAAITPPPPGM